jgi:Photosynthetic reaction centre cytochrome C subunit
MRLLLPILLLLAADGRIPAASTSTDVERDNAATVHRMAERIRGREEQPASIVFRNIKLDVFRSVPAGVFLDVMQGGYAAALGVRCTHCHVEKDFASDEKRPKQAAREMAVMHKAINNQLLAMKHLKSEGEDRFINCSTCHRGKVDPHE